jgi:hypothetical protein
MAALGDHHHLAHHHADRDAEQQHRDHLHGLHALTPFLFSARERSQPGR